MLKSYKWENACSVAMAWISARWNLAPENWDWHSLGGLALCCSFNCIHFSSWLIEWVLRDCASHACVLSTWAPVGAGMLTHSPSKSTNEYSPINATNANLQTQGEINLKVYSTNFHTSLTSTLDIFSQFWLSKNFLRSLPRLMMLFWELNLSLKL